MTARQVECDPIYLFEPQKVMISLFRLVKYLAHLVAGIGLAAAANAAPQDPVALEHFIDGVWYSQKQSHPSMGAVVTVVKDGEIWLNKGYGWADWDTQTRVDAEQSLFRIASISKPFTWIAAMQLVEQGRLDLDEDVNAYLSAFQIPATFPEPITMRHLMSHNAGFEDVVIDLGRRSAAELQPLGEYLADHLPRRMRPPGVFSSYSNHSTAIAAHVVEAISGLDWSTYIEQNVLVPLQMERTSARHPMAEKLRTSLATSYSLRGGEWRPQEFLHWFIYPAGMMSTTGADMARFMLSQLAGGPPLLSEATHQLMLQPVYRPFDAANAWLHGYVERNANGVVSYGHGGDLNGYHSELALFPELNLGVFVAVNTDPSANFGMHLIDALLDYHFPQAPPSVPRPSADALQMQEALHGAYAGLRRNFSDFSKLALLIGHVQVDTNDDGYLTLSSGNGTKQFSSVGDDRFVARYDHEVIQFVRDENGDVSHLHRSGFAASTMDKLAWFANPTLHQYLFAVVGLVALITIVSIPLAVLRRRLGKGGAGDIPPLPAWFNGLLFLLALGVLVNLFMLIQGLQNTDDMYFGIPPRIVAALVLSSVVCAGMLACAFAGGLLLARGVGTLSGRLGAGVFCITSLMYVWLCYYWNILVFL